MRSKAALAIVLCLLLGTGPAAAESPVKVQGLAVEWIQGEQYYPQDEPWTYHYSYRYPFLTGDGLAQEAINDYFRNALNEMTMLVIPMFAADPIMVGDGGNEISQNYEITCNNDDYFSILLTQAQTVDGEARTTLQSAVFAASGEYTGQSLTLRGLVEVGPSSQALGEAVLQDIWEDIKSQMRDVSSGWKSNLSSDILRAEFYPEVHFYADSMANAVFYLQPGQFRQDGRAVTYTYTPQRLEELLAEQD
jgi:hypothetical protein